jgi:hypothetical protein
MTDALLKIIPTMQSVTLLDYNLKKMKKKKRKVGDLIEQGVGNIIGVSMINETANFIGD